MSTPPPDASLLAALSRGRAADSAAVLLRTYRRAPQKSWANVDATVLAFLEMQRFPGEPGRRGHPAEFYEAIAREYAELADSDAVGVRRAMAERRHVSENTVKGWVREARRRGLLDGVMPRKSRGPGSGIAPSS